MTKKHSHDTQEPAYQEIKAAFSHNAQAFQEAFHHYLDHHIDEPFFYSSLLRYAKLLAKEKDEKLAKSAVELIIIAHEQNHDDPSMQDQAQKDFKIVLGMLPIDLRVYSALTVYARVEQSGSIRDSNILLDDCDEQLAAAFDEASQKCIAAAKRLQKNPKATLEPVDFYCDLFLIYAAAVPPDYHSVHKVFFDSYKKTTEKLDADKNDEIAVLVDVAIASQLPEQYSIVQMATENFSRHIKSAIGKAQTAENRDHVREFFENVPINYPSHNNEFLAAVRKAEDIFDPQPTERPALTVEPQKVPGATLV